MTRWWLCGMMAVCLGLFLAGVEVEASLGEGEIRTIVRAINYERQQVNPPAANMKQTMWSVELAKAAEKEADKCQTHADPQIGRHVSLSYSFDPTETLQALFKMFFDEKKHYDAAAKMCTAGYLCSDYKQLVYWDSENVGCFERMCPELQEGTEKHRGSVLVCIFSNPEELNKVAYETGTKPCSDCPMNYVCNDKLCVQESIVKNNATSNEIPVEEKKSEEEEQSPSPGVSFNTTSNGANTTTTTASTQVSKLATKNDSSSKPDSSKVLPSNDSSKKLTSSEAPIGVQETMKPSPGVSKNETASSSKTPTPSSKSSSSQSPKENNVKSHSDKPKEDTSPGPQSSEPPKVIEEKISESPGVSLNKTETSSKQDLGKPKHEEGNSTQASSTNKNSSTKSTKTTTTATSDGSTATSGKDSAKPSSEPPKTEEEEQSQSPGVTYNNNSTMTIAHKSVNETSDKVTSNNTPVVKTQSSSSSVKPDVSSSEAPKAKEEIQSPSPGVKPIQNVNKTNDDGNKPTNGTHNPTGEKQTASPGVNKNGTSTFDQMTADLKRPPSGEEDESSTTSTTASPEGKASLNKSAKDVGKSSPSLPKKPKKVAKPTSTLKPDKNDGFSNRKDKIVVNDKHPEDQEIITKTSTECVKKEIPEENKTKLTKK